MAQMLDPVKWSFDYKAVSDTEFDLIFKAEMEPKWAIYSQYLESDDGPIPTSFQYDEGGHFKLVGKNAETGYKKEGFDPLFEMNVVKYLKHAEFTQRIKVTDLSKPVTGYLTFMTCDDERCLPPTDVDFSFTLKAPAKQTPAETPQDGKTESPAPEEETPAAPTTAETTTQADSAAFPGAYNLKGTPVDYAFDHSWDAANCEDTPAPAEEKQNSLWIIFLLGIGGGLLALLTPCVFPMVPLTVSYFTKSSSDRKSGINNAIWYGLSIIVIYVFLGLVITGIFGADALNLLSTNAWFNIFFALLFIIFGISFFGYFEITLPSSWSTRSDRMAGKGGLLGIFFMAFTLSLVSFSCTGPIIGTLLVETATGGGPTLFGRIPAGPLMGMLGFSVALALPFALFAAFPGWLNSLPKSGGWMNSVKVTLGFVEIALALKFFSIADLTMGWKFMPYEAFVGLWVLIALALGLYFLGYLRFPHDGPRKPLTAGRGVMVAISGALLIYLLTGFRYSEKSETFVTPNLLSGLAPPAGHSYIYPKHCPLDINCFKDFEQGLAYAKEHGKPILLDFTGHGCVNCRRMEDNVWGQEGVFELISDKYVLISLYVDDRKELEEPYKSPFSGRMMRTVGNKWADFQAIHFNRNSQPYYVLLSDDLKVLNEPRAYTPDKEEYQAFLECGLEKYSAYKQMGSAE
jgi:thiol:disulfide interchange protein DsbD